MWSRLNAAITALHPPPPVSGWRGVEPACPLRRPPRCSRCPPPSPSPCVRMERRGASLLPQAPTALFAVPSPAAPSPTVYRACLEEGRSLLGRIYLDRGDLEEAIGLFELVDTPTAYLSLGKASRRTTRWRQLRLGNLPVIFTLRLILNMSS